MLTLTFITSKICELSVRLDGNFFLLVSTFLNAIEICNNFYDKRINLFIDLVKIKFKLEMDCTYKFVNLDLLVCQLFLRNCPVMIPWVVAICTPNLYVEPTAALSNYKLYE